MNCGLRGALAAGVAVGLGVGSVGVASAALSHAAPSSADAKKPPPKPTHQGPSAGQFCSKTQTGRRAIGANGTLLVSRRSGQNHERWAKASTLSS